jgi:cell wall-associated NlpC family hydrolase
VGGHPAVRTSLRRRGVVGIISLVLVGAFVTYGSVTVSAAPQPTTTQLKERLSKLMSQLDSVSQQYDQSLTELKTAKATLTRINQQIQQDELGLGAMRIAIAQIASAAYMQGDINSTSALLASSDPQVVLDRADVLSHLSANRRAQLTTYIAAAAHLHAQQLTQQRTTAAIAQLEKAKAAQQRRLKSLIASNQAELSKLTAPPVSATPASGGIIYHGPATGAARVAVSFALSQIGAPYVYGGTGPYNAGYDCSGLVMTAWAAAGVQIPRTTYDQWAALPHISTASIKPGDLMYYDGEGHVAMYVGNGMIVDAPQPGQTVEEIPMSTSWYAQTFDGAARP